ncbi:hypothetical protein PGT21_019526 [Puccinia graminis f. sp. tritici]|uniref:ATP-dependent DNA helicase sgs1 n=1 Tax=Puccinia graminis f. sp. tritici TaxID=56615 RepID=A0A5B0LUG1_PUCGR|nr:hypothetical protein PGTUg99_033334 [Puccinia graminis f. sp. tritici]KAA1104331.1 hypothetical protein PGT21_019526 [Puccinia graminis f. sp. tritici]
MPPRRKKLNSPKPKSNTTKRPKTTSADSNSTTANSEPSKPWPTFFQQLQRVYQALNTVFTFCSTRKQLHTTIDNMRSSVESLIKCQLELDSISQIKTLLPDLIRFTFVDKDTLGALDEISAPTKKQRKTKDLNIYDPQSSRSEHPTSEEEAVRVLLFQFLDGELKTAQKHARKLPRQHARLKDQSGPSTRSIQDTVTAHDLLTPTYSPQMMIKMVEKRNLKFKEAVEELLEACAAEDPQVDPVQLLVECATSNNPIRPENTDSETHDYKLPTKLELPSEVPTIECVLEQLKASPQYHDQIVENGEHVTPARQAYFKDLERSQLSPEIHRALESTKGITRLYFHQARAIDLLSEGSNVIVTTSTSSGKSLIYQIPMLQALENSHSSCGLYIFPTKALAQDQKRSLDELILSYGEPLSRRVRVETYDGDTPSDERAGIRKDAKVIFTNPDMLHSAILPNEEQWRRFFQNLRYVVVDELHIYSGLFGAHVAMIMRRLRRMCEAVGNAEVRFISCSATTINPEEHMKSLFGFDQVALVSEDGAPSGAKRHVIWNPPLVDQRDPGQGRVSAIVETSRVFRFLLERGVRTIVFCRVRRTCELLMKQVQEDLVESGRRELKERVRAYRAGYTTQERRLIESEMFSGALLGIIATTALELGIDIGGLDAVLSLGFPHSLSGLIQQAGRAGRRSKDSLAMLVLEQRGLDQHFARHPEELFQAHGSSVSLDLHNPRLLLAHLHCAAHEIPVVPAEDSKFFGPSLQQLCDAHLAMDGEGFFHTGQSNPSQLISIRGLITTNNGGLDGSSSDSYTIVDFSTPHHPKILEDIERERVLFECFEGAVFLHQGASLIVSNLDHRRQTVSVRSAAIHFLTRPIVASRILPQKTLTNLPILPDSTHFIFLGKLLITTKITGYLKVDAKNRSKVLDRIELPNEANGKDDGMVSNELSTSTVGVWIDLPASIIQSLASLFVTPQPSSISDPTFSFYPKINLVIHLLEHLILFFLNSNHYHQLKLKSQQSDSEQKQAAVGQAHYPLLKTTCKFFKAAAFRPDYQHQYQPGFRNQSSVSEGANHEEFKLIDRILVYEDPKKNLDRSIVDGLQYDPDILSAADHHDLGSGLTDLACNIQTILDLVLAFLDECPCVHGCLQCVFKPICPHLVFPTTAQRSKNKKKMTKDEGGNDDEGGKTVQPTKSLNKKRINEDGDDQEDAHITQSTKGKNKKKNDDEDVNSDKDDEDEDDDDEGKRGQNVDDVIDDDRFHGLKFGVLVLANGLLDRVWVPDE